MIGASKVTIFGFASVAKMTYPTAMARIGPQTHNTIGKAIS